MLHVEISSEVKNVEIRFYILYKLQKTCLNNDHHRKASTSQIEKSIVIAAHQKYKGMRKNPLVVKRWGFHVSTFAELIFSFVL